MENLEKWKLKKIANMVVTLVRSSENEIRVMTCFEF